MASAHTYYLAARDRWLPHGGASLPPPPEAGSITLPDGTLSPAQVAARACRGERADDETLCMLLREIWATLATLTDPTPVDGVSAWLDDAGATQMRLVRNAVAEPLTDPDLVARVHARLTTAR